MMNQLRRTMVLYQAITCFEGTLINLPAYVTNPDNLKAVFTVTVEDTVYDETEFVST